MKHAVVPLYDVWVYFATDREDVKAFIRENSVTVDTDLADMKTCRGCTTTIEGKTGDMYRVLCVFDDDFDTLVHEAVHLALVTMKHIGIKFSPSNEETLANLTAWIVVEFTKQFPEFLKDKGE